MHRTATHYENQRRIVLVGKTGNGKSSTGNTILNREDAFSEAHNFTPGNIICKRESQFRQEQMMTYDVVDTPGLFDTDASFAERAIEIQRAYHITNPPHVFLLVLRADQRMSDEEQLVVDMMQIIFGRKMLDHTIVVFTHGSKYENNESLLQFAKESKNLKELVEKCGNRVARIENVYDENDEEATNEMVTKLFQMIEDVSCDGTKMYEYSCMLTHTQILKDHLAENKERKDIQAELQTLIDDLGRQISRDKWKPYMVGGAVGVAGVAAGAAGAFYFGPTAIAAVVASKTAPVLGAVAGAVASNAGTAWTSLSGFVLRR